MGDKVKQQRKPKRISLKEKALVDYYLLGYKLADCYEMAGYACSTASYTRDNKAGKAHTALARPQVQEYLEQQRAELSKEVKWTREKAIRSLVKVVDETKELGFGGGNQIVNAVREANKMCGFDKPEEVVDVEASGWEIPASMMGRAFVDIHRSIHNREYSEYWFEGGRGSLKSSTVALEVIQLLENNPNMCAIAVRNVGNTIGDSIYAQLIWAIQVAGLDEKYTWIKSPYEITKKSTGQKIYFRGADDPAKIKSIRPPKDMYLGIHWMEEVDQLSGMEGIRNIEQSITRGGDIVYKFKSYNTPKSALHFINKEKLLPKKGRVIHKSTYLDAPLKFLGQPFIDDAEYLKQVNPKAYDHEYMGIAIGEDGMVFSNVEVREITKEEYKGFNEELQGLDWGFYPDPLAWNSGYYSPKDKTLYITDEATMYKKRNEAAYNQLNKEGKIKDHVQIIADSAEPKSIQDFKEYGAWIDGVKKFPGSVDYTMKWLASLVKIVIDPSCVDTIKEFTEYELEKDKDGNYISVYPDRNNHHIDAVRYMTQPCWKVRGQ